MSESDTASLRVLVAVAETGSFSAAAGRLGVTQQAVSARMRTLEARLGVPLVRRSARGSAMTAEGSVIAGWAADVVSAADVFAASVRTLVEADPAPLRVAASLTIAEYLVPEWLHRLRVAGAPAVELTAANSAAVAESVRAGRADIGFVETPTAPTDLASRRFATDELVTVVAPGHPWARRISGVTPTELATRPLVVREAGSGTREALDLALDGREDRAVPAAVLPTTAMVRAMAAAGDAPAVLSVLAVTEALRAGTLVRVRVRGLRITRPLSVVWARGTELSTPARALLDLIADR
ncbi:LysR family transcriptional regulator [Mycetocola tolaasinivorans]|uniref:LysR family transcriptional regulator n=1 Tax=Mycetocola tolaasinivorans TaxID=76635 RepID=A0A3L7A8V4_9MICO|nr:LysR family transcriptional regulator [Mycetocola tolaasinivorans]RLP76783.1 LysR family transcriptional regulator [Mycetocola tolaasinivorans]